MTEAAQQLLTRVNNGERIVRGTEDKAVARELFALGYVRWKQEAAATSMRGWGVIYVMVRARTGTRPPP